MDPLITTATSRDEQDRAARVAVLPVASFEQHGDFLPLITDTVVAGLIARRVSAEYALFLLPPVTLSCSHEHSGFAGTVSVSAPTLAAVVNDVAESLHASGIDRLAIVNGHGGNYVLANVVQQANIAGPRMTLFPSRMDWDVARTAAELGSTASEDMHAGELEVSLLLHGYPQLVDDRYQGADWQADPRPHLLVTGMRGYTETGVIGRPSLASADKGRAILESLARSFKDHLACFPRMPARDDVGLDVMPSSRISKSLLALLVRSFSTTSRPALRAAACGGRPRPAEPPTGGRQSPRPPRSPGGDTPAR